MHTSGPYSGLRDRRFRRSESHHMALRYQGDKPVRIDGKDVMPDVRAVLAAMKDFSEAVRSGAVRGTGAAVPVALGHRADFSGRHRAG